MLSIILTILKIIGFVILALLGLLLLILLTTLLVPIRYRIVVEHGESLYVKGRVHWLLHIIHAGISYVEDKLHIQVRLFGLVIFDNLKPKVPKTKKPKSMKSKGKKRSIKKSKSKKIQNAKQLKERNTKVDSDSKTTVTVPREEKNPDVINASSESKISSENKLVIKKKEIEENKAVSDEENRTVSDEVNRTVSENKKSFFQKLCARFIEFKEKLIAGVHSFISRIKNLFTTLKKVHYKWDLLKKFIQDEINRQGFSVTYKSLKKILKHILPTRLRSEIIFGTGDPCSTGQLLGVLGFFYGFYGDKIKITPDFENSRFEGKHDARGRIRLVSILIIVVKLILNKRFKQLRKNVTLLKEAL